MSDLALPYVLPAMNNPDLEFGKYFNFLKSLMNRRGRLTRLDSVPFDLTMDLASACQLKCPYCSTGNGTIARQKFVIKDDVYARILGEVGDACFIIWYFSVGEPLLHKRFGELVATTRHQEIFSVISTNLSLRLSDAYLRQLLSCGLGMISVSLDGATEATYRQYRRGGDFDLVVENIRRLLALKREMGLVYPLIEWRFLRFAHNEHEEQTARALAAELGVDILEFWNGAAPPAGSPNNEGVHEATTALQGPLVSGPSLDAMAAQQSATKLLAGLTPGIEVGGWCEPDQFTAKCDWLYFSGMIHPTGRVGPCCVANDEPDDFVQSLDAFSDYNAVFNSPLHAAARTMFTTGRASGTVCDRCPAPSAQHYQFRMKLRAILRNAPEWVVGILASSPGSFFLPEDERLVPEVALLKANVAGLAGLVDQTALTRLRTLGDPAAHRMRAYVTG